MTAPADETGLDPEAAAALLRRTMADTRRSLNIGNPVIYAGWGVAWLVGLGGMWLTVRTQAPYRGPSGGAFALLGVVMFGAAALTVAAVVRATRGVRGPSEVQARMFGLAWPIGFGAMSAVEAALAVHGANVTVMGLLGAAGPMLVTALIYLVGAAIWLDRAMFTMGAWVAVVCAAAVWTGPVTVLLVEAVAGGGGFLVMAGYLAWRR